MVGTRRLSLLLPLLANLVTVTLGQQAIRINCGSTGTMKDKSGREWLSDRFYTKGSNTYSSTDSIRGTSDDFLFQTERWQKNKSDHMKYEIPVPEGQVNVRLLFAENYVTASGKRVFDVRIEGSIPSAFRRIDIYAKAGKNKMWESPVHQTTVTDGKLSIEFIDRIGNPKISAIEVIPLGRNNAASLNLHEDIRYVADLTHTGERPLGKAWADSYSVGDRCYCDGMTTYDHEIENFFVNTAVGWKTVRQICELLGPGPGSANRPIYNDIQCGNGPPNNAGDEHTCPGRVDKDFEGCNQIGPKWNFKDLPVNAERSRYFLDVGGPLDSPHLITSTGKTWTYDSAKDKKVTIKNNGAIPVTVYQTHRSGKELEYTIGGFDPLAPYQVSLGFAEVWEDTCARRKRVMRLKINDNPYTNNLDVFEEAGGCGHALIKSYILTASGKGEFVINLFGAVENAMLSSVDIKPVGL